jgi:hypothetical protein
MINRLSAALIVTLLIVLAVLAYGYWFGSRHGALYVSVVDISDPARLQDVVPVQLSFLDQEGRTLAIAESIPPSGTIFIVSPAAFACHAAEERAALSIESRKQWTECFARQSRWLPTWIRRVRTVDLRSGSCLIKRLPIIVSEHPDTWWLWWAPVRHIGGLPYTSFTSRIELDRRLKCRP